MALFLLSVSSTAGFGGPKRLRHVHRLESPQAAFPNTILFSTSTATPGDSFSRNSERNESSDPIKSLYDFADTINESSDPNNDRVLLLLSAARKQLKQRNVTKQQRKDLSQKMDDSIQILTTSAFSPPYENDKRILNGVKVVQSLASNDYGLCVPYNLIPIKTILSAITALTTYVKAFAKENPTMTRDQRNTESQMANEAFRLLQRLVSGSGIRVRDPFVREAEFTRVLDAFCTAGRMDMAERVVALQERASNAPPVSTITYSVLIRGYGDAGNVEQVTRVFDESQSRGIQVDTIMMNSLIDAYINCGDIFKANQIFRRMKRGEAEAPANLRTYNTMLKGWAENGRLDQVKRLSNEMQKTNDLWDNVTVNTVVHAAVLQQDWAMAEQMLSDHTFRSRKNERHPQVEAYNELLNGYAEFGMIDEALHIYAEMEKRNVTPTEVTFCCILRALGTQNDLSAANEVLKRMISMGLTPSAKVFGALISGITSSSTSQYYGDDGEHAARLFNAIAVLSRMVDIQCFPPPMLVAIILDFMSRSQPPKIHEALGLVNTIVERDIVQRGDEILWTALMKYYSSVGQPAAALATFQEIQSPDVAAVNQLLDICAKTGNHTRVTDVFHRHFKPHGHLPPDIISYSTILTSFLSGPYSRKNFAEARKWYKELKACKAISLDNAFVDLILKLVLRNEVIDVLTRSDVYFIAAILNDAETLSWGPGQLERRKRVARGLLRLRLYILFGDENFLDSLLAPDSDMLFERKGWNQVESGFTVWGRPFEEGNTEDRFLEQNGWNSVDSGFRLF